MKAAGQINKEKFLKDNNVKRKKQKNGKTNKFQKRETLLKN